MTNSRLKKGIAAATALAVIVLGGLFIISALNISLTGGANPYEREAVGGYLLPLIPTVLITVLLIIFGFVLSHGSDKPSGKDRSERSSYEKLKDYAKRFEDKELPEKEANIIRYERSRRFSINVLFFSVSAVLAAVALAYVIFFAEFTVSELNGNILLAFSVALPLLIASVGVHILRVCLLEQSAKNEYAALKECIKKSVEISAPKGPKIHKNEAKITLTLKISVLILAVAFVVVGIFNGGMEDVLDKAVKICTECIGLG